LAQSQRTVEVQKGLTLIRYESAKDESRPPTVFVKIASGSESIAELMLPSDTSDPILWSPGGCLVVRAVGPARLDVEVNSLDPSGSVAAKLELLQLTSDPAEVRKLSSPSGPPDLSAFRLLGHVAGVGDVTVGAMEWIAGPKAPARIEGFSIDWPDMPGNIGLRYLAKMGGPRPETSAFVEAGQYVGTRGRALPLVGVTLELTGTGAIRYNLVSDAIFLDSPQMRVSGRCVVLSAHTGREPLLGLRIAIEPC